MTHSVLMHPSYEIKLFPVEDEYIGCFDARNTEFSSERKRTHVETIIILDRSGSMWGSIKKFVNEILPKFFENLKYDYEAPVTFITFEDIVEVHKLKVGDFKTIDINAGGDERLALAVNELHKIFEQFESSGSAFRILTISDGAIGDRQDAIETSGKLAQYAAKCNISVNSHAVRLFTSRSQPDTEALCSLMQLSNVEKSKMVDINSEIDSDLSAKKMSDLFENDGFSSALVLKSDEEIFYKFPWDEKAFNQLYTVPDKNNIFWMDGVPNEKQQITIDDIPVKIKVEKQLSMEMFELLISSKFDYILAQMKILKIVNTDSSRLTIEKMVQYFSRIENIIVSLVTDVAIDPKSIDKRAKLLKLNRLRSKKITTILETIANDDAVSKLNAAQKALYLRNVQASSKSGRGLAKRNAKKNKKARRFANKPSFDEIARKQVRIKTIKILID